MAKAKLKVSVVISWYVNELIGRLHNQYPHTERSGIARIEKKQGYYYVSDIRFPKQSNKWAETEISNWWLEEILEDILAKNPEQLWEWKCRLHSHHSMWCFRSGTDEAAKKSFNDGQQDFRWSIVTAYKANSIAYKCALNVFKPINIEFNVPVTQEEFDEGAYLTQTMPDYATYEKAYNQLLLKRNAEIELLNEEYVPAPEEIEALLNIFNVEQTPDNTQACNDLLVKGYKWRRASMLETIDDTFEMEVKELQSFFGWDPFEDKLKELKNNIIAPTYSYWQSQGWWWYSKQYEIWQPVGFGQQLFNPYDFKEKEEKEMKLKQEMKERYFSSYWEDYD